MTITPEVLREVAEYVACLDLDSTARDLRKVAERIHDRELLDGPDRALASALRTAYYDDAECYDVKYSSVPRQWLRMAEAARKQVEAELDVDVQAAQFVEREPRTWAKAAEVPDAVCFAERRTACGGSWVREGAEYRYRYSDGVTQGTLWPEYGVNEYAPFVEVLP